MTVPASSTVHSARRALLAGSAAATVLGWCLSAQALPTGGVTATGTASIGTLGATTTVTQSSSRVVIDWNTFNIANGETVQFAQPSSSSIAFNRIGFNFPGATTTNIDGALNANGGVWLFSPAGLIIGSNARINVGSFLATTGTVNFDCDCTPPSGPPDSSSSGNSISIGGAINPLKVQSGAQINANDGFVLLNSEVMTQNGDITATDGVGLDIGGDTTVTFQTGASGPAQQLTGADLSLSLTGTPSLDHGGSIKGAWVAVYAPSTVSSGFSGVINLGGTIEATGVAPTTAGTYSVVLLGGGGDPHQFDFSNELFDINASKGTLKADQGGLFISGKTIELGKADLNGSLGLEAYSDVSLDGVVVTTGSADVYSFYGGVTINAKTDIGGDLRVYGDTVIISPGVSVSADGNAYVGAYDSVTLGANSVLRGDADGAGGGYAAIIGGSVDADATSLIATGKSGGPATDNVTVYSYGGDIKVGAITGTLVRVRAHYAGGDFYTSGDITFNGNVSASTGVYALSDAGSVTINSGITSAGTVYVGAFDTITIAPAVTVQADSGGKGIGEVYLEATTIDAAPTSLLLAGPNAGAPSGGVTVYADGGDLKVGQVSGTVVKLSALAGPGGSGAGGLGGPGGSLFLEGAVLGATSVTGTSAQADVSVDANVSSGGGISLTAPNGAMTIGTNVTIQADSGGAGAGGVNLSAGSDITADSSSLVLAGGAASTPTDFVDIVAGGDLTTGAVSGTDVELSSPGDLTITGAVLGTNSVVLDPTNLIIEADVTSGSNLNLYASNSISIGLAGKSVTVSAKGAIDAEAPIKITLLDKATLQSDSNGDSDTGEGVFMESGTIDAAPTSLILAGPSQGSPDDIVTVLADGGDLKVGAVSGTVVRLEARGLGASGATGGAGTGPGGSLFIDGPVLGTSSVYAVSDFAGVDVEGNVTSGGPVQLGAYSDMTIGAFKVQGDSGGTGAGGVDIYAGGSITANKASLVLAGASAAAPSDFVTIEAGGGDLTTGAVAGTNVGLYTPDDLTINGTVFGSQSVTLDPANIFINANVTSGGPLDIFADDTIVIAKNVTVSAAGAVDAESSTSITLGAGSKLQSDSGGKAAGGIYMESGEIDADPTSLILAGSSATAPTDGVMIFADGGDLTVGAVSGTAVKLEARGTGATGPSGGAGSGPGGSLFVDGAVLGTSSVSGYSDFGAVTVKANVTSAGSVTFYASDDMTIAASVTIKSDSGGAGAGGVDLTTRGNFSADKTSLVVAGKSSTTPTDFVDISADGDLTTGAVSGTTVDLINNGDLTINGAILGTQNVFLDPTNIFINANVTSGGPLDIQADNTIVVLHDVKVSAAGAVDAESGVSITLGAKSTLQSDSGGKGAGGVYMESGEIDADATSLILAGPNAAAPTDTVTVFADGGDLNVGAVSGTVVKLEARGLGASGATGGAGSGPGGSLFINGPVLGTTSVSGVSDFADVDVKSNVTSGGAVTLSADGDMTVAAAVTIKADSGGKGAGGADLSAGGVFTADKTSLVLAGTGAATPTDFVDISAGGDLTTGAISGTTVDLTNSGDLTINGAIFGSQNVFLDPTNIFINANVKSGGPLDIIANNDIAIASGVTVSAAGAIDAESSGAISLGANSVLQSDAAGKGAGGIYMESGEIDANATSLILAGPSAGAPTDAVTVFADGGDLTVGAVSGTVVKLEARGTGAAGPSGGAGSGPGGSLFVDGAVLGTSSVTGASDFSDVAVNANVTSGGAVTLTANGDMTVASAVMIKADSAGKGAGGVGLSAGGLFTADQTSLVLAGASSSAPTDFVTIQAGGDLTSGAVSGTVVEFFNSGDLTINGPVLGTQSVLLDPVNIFINANVTSGGSLNIFADNDIAIASAVTVSAAGAVDAESSGSISMGANSVLQSDSGGKGAGGIYMESGAIDADPTSTILAGPSAGAPTGAVTVFADGGDLKVGAVSGTVVHLEARGHGASGASGGAGSGPGGSLFIAGLVQGDTSVTGLSDFADVNVSGDVASAGTVVLTAAGAMTVGAGVQIQSDSAGKGAGGVSMTAGGKVTADATSLVLAGQKPDTPTDSVDIKGGDDVTTGQVAGTDVTLTTPNDLTIGGAVLGTKSVTFDPQNIFILANVTSGGFLDVVADDTVSVANGVVVKAATQMDVSATTITVGAGSVLQSDAGGAGAGAMTITAGGDFTADATSLVEAGTSAAAPTDVVNITAGAGEGGGNLTAGQTSGTEVHLTAFGQSDSGGNLTLGGPVFGSTGVWAYSDLDDDGATSGQTNVLADVNSNGTIDIRSEGAGPLNVGQGASIVSDGGEVYLASNHDLILGKDSTVSGASFAGVAQGLLQIQTGASVSTTGTSSAPVWPIVPTTIIPAGADSDTRTPTITSLNLAAADLDIQGSVTSGASGARDDIYIQALGDPGAVTVGGDGSALGFNLSNDSLGHLTGRNVVVMGGDGEGGGQNADITLANLTLNSANVSGLWLGTSSDHLIDVTGQVTVTGPNGVDVRLGFARSRAGGPSGPTGPSSTLDGFIPGEIDISGGLGTAEAPLGAVSLLARHDIFMGTTGFITAARGDSAFDAVKQSKDFPGLDPGHVFIATATLQLGAQGRIIQQNTSTSQSVLGNDFAGLIFNAPTADTPLIVAPAALKGATLGTEGWTASFESGPTAIDVFGSIQLGGGKSESGVGAALQDNLLDAAITLSQAYRINSCIFESHCVTAVLPPFVNPIIPIFTVVLLSTFETDIAIGDTNDEDRKKNGAPVTQSGNGDLWTGPPPPETQ